MAVRGIAQRRLVVVDRGPGIAAEVMRGFAFADACRHVLADLAEIAACGFEAGNDVAHDCRTCGVPVIPVHGIGHAVGECRTHSTG